MNLFLEEVKANAGITSNNQLAKAIGVSPELVSRWNLKKSEPNGLNALKLAQLGKIEAKRAIELMEGGFSNVLLLLVTSTSALAYVSISYAIFYGSTVYIMLNDLIKKIQRTFVFQSPLTASRGAFQPLC